jgi:4-amino-4-deoxy-L-arabinose transferase-like glycosyltransferase
MAPIVLSESGTTFIDVLTAVPVLAGYALLLRRGRTLKSGSATTLAGVLIGVATALKLTNAVFAFGAIGFALAGPESLRQRLRWLTLCGGCALIAFLAVGGRWHLSLWEHFHNPFFPYYNNIFQSPDFLPLVLRDDRFLSNSVLDIWRYPLYWLLGGSPANEVSSPGLEVSFRDARWTFVTFGGAVFPIVLAIFPRWRKERLSEPATGCSSRLS